MDNGTIIYIKFYKYVYCYVHITIIPVYISLSYRVFWLHLSKIHLTSNMPACYRWTYRFSVVPIVPKPYVCPLFRPRCYARHPVYRVGMPRHKKSGDDTLPSPLFFYWFSCSASPIKYGKKTLHIYNGYRNDSLTVSKFISSRTAGLAVDGRGIRSEMRSAIMSVIRMSSWLSRPSMLPYEPSSLCS